MNKDLNLRDWLSAFKEGQFNSKDTNIQIEAGWYDWFCKDESLAGKTAKLGAKLKQIVDSPKLKPEEQYVFFKNNCPMNGSLYDDFRICDIESGDVIFCIVPRSGHRSLNGLGEVWGKENGFKEALFQGTWKEIKEWFNKE